ncbi:glycine betaine ABC transporter substrate-binding protein [Pontibacillus marinus]|uniref:Glycine/betaine ABC transporter n=1 Tax=Pontibacillus marinus BH030004 = DSM 16465 TaxID=1385511 RepID=A0A0A5HL98_9BACI|nr:glycine betaine ABC transporter substrate-binding protein [Pontibacillus marinus]KGX84397.1 glycine/betaine ABC transporter [Pontibacillus marinus BH030004 = DSM 16465]
MNMMKKWLPVLGLGLLLILAACGGNNDTDQGEGNGDATDNEGNTTEEKGTLQIGLNNWAENVAVSNMWKVILEDKGYTVELKTVEKAALYEALKNDDLDVGLEVWLPHTDKPLYESYKEDVAFHKDETWFEGTELGLYVPEYVEDINSIPDLKGKADKFGGNIVGIDAGSSLYGLTEDALKEYGLENYDQQSASGPFMTAELGNAIKDEEPILVTLWKPHWVFAEYKVKLLKDPKGVYGEKEDISWMSRQGFKEDMPKVAKAIKTWKMDDESLGSLMNEVKKADEALDGARTWVENNQDLVKEWTSHIE